MENPFVVCHMFVSMDGKIDGAFMSSPAAVPARTEYGKLRDFYKCQATLYGTVTMYGGFADGLLPEVPASSASYPMEDWTALHTEDSLIISTDPKGTLAWSKNYIQRPGRPKSHVIEALMEQVPPDYLAYCQTAQMEKQKEQIIVKSGWQKNSQIRINGRCRPKKRQKARGEDVV